jgi:Polyketide cyclase / dehydrase and lipid transport
MSDPVTASVAIDARPEVVYGLITDLPTLASLAEEAVAMEWRKGDAVRTGAVFVGHNENEGRRWTTKCRTAANTEHIKITLQRLKQRAETG